MNLPIGNSSATTYINTVLANAKQKKTVAVIGYGSQGRAIALNLRDSGYDVVPGLRSRSKSHRVARADGFSCICRIGQAVASVDTVIFAFPDHLHGRVYKREIQPNLQRRTTLLFLHGFSIHFSLVVPPDDCDVIMIAPHAPGVAVREKFLSNRTISAFWAIHQNRSRQARQTIMKLAPAIGIDRKRFIKSSFAEEAVGDLFGEQAVLCGGLAMLIKSGFEVLVERGWKPENAYLEVAYQLDLIVDLIKKHGIEGMLKRISVTARYGSLLAGPRVIDKTTRTKLDRVFRDIESGRFARRLASLKDDDITDINKKLTALTNHRLERAARKFSD